MTLSSVAEHLEHAERTVILPSVLLINFGIFQYLVLLFHNKARRQPYVCLLLLTSAISVVVLVPYATQDAATVNAMNDVSESCLALILLLQTVYALKDSRVIDQSPNNSHTKLKVSNAGEAARSEGHEQQITRQTCFLRTALRVMRVFADLLIVLDSFSVVLCIIEIFSPSTLATFGSADEINLHSEMFTLVYTFAYRFGALGLRKGSARVIVREDGLEVIAHVCFVLHELPFLIVRDMTGVSLDVLQMLVMRVTLVPCVWMTIGEHHYRHPTNAQLSQMPATMLHELIQRASVVARAKTPRRRSNSRLGSFALSLGRSSVLVSVSPPSPPKSTS
jgi:hypothetical protein